MNGGLAARRPTTAILLAAAAALRLGAFLALRSVFDFTAGGALHGSAAYDTYAVNLLSTGVYGLTPGMPDATLPPLYSVLVAGVYRIAGRGALPLVLANTALDLLTIAALTRIGSRLFPSGVVVGVLAAALTAAYPYFVFQSLTVIDTSLFTALLFGFLVLVIELGESGTGARRSIVGAAAGLLLGLALLTRPILPPLVVLVALWLAARLGWRTALARMVPVVLAAALVVGVWTVRNSLIFGRPVAVTTNGGSNFWHGNNPQTVPYLRAGYDVQWARPPAIDSADRFGPAADAEFFRQAVDYLRSHPAGIPLLWWTKLTVQWSVDVSPRLNPTAAQAAAGDLGSTGLSLNGLTPDAGVAAYSQPLFDRYGRAIHRMYWGTLLFLGVIGVWRTRASWRDVSLVLSVPLALTAVYIVFHPSTRYRMPGDPAVFLFSSSALVWLWQATRRPRAVADDTVADGAHTAQLPPACCWLGSVEYTQPLDSSTARKWEALSRLGIGMHVVAFSADGRGRTFTDHATFHLLPTPTVRLLRRLTWLLRAPIVVLRVIARDNVRVIVAQSPIEGALAAGIKLLLQALGRQVALVIESHGDFERAPSMYRRVRFAGLYRGAIARAARFGLRHADVARAASGATREQLAEYATGLPIDVFPAWIDLETFGKAERQATPSRSSRVLFAGSLVPAKGLHVLIDAFAPLVVRFPGAHLAVAGRSDKSAYVDGLRAQLVRLNLTEHVTFLGQLKADDVREQMERARVLVLPSLSEGFGRVLIEAMLAGTPVVGTRVGGVPEIVADGETGFLVPPADDRSLTEVLVRVFDDDAGIDAMGSRARNRARQIVSSGAFVEGHRRLLDAAWRRLGLI